MGHRQRTGIQGGRLRVLTYLQRPGSTIATPLHLGQVVLWPNGGNGGGDNGGDDIFPVWAFPWYSDRFSRRASVISRF